LQKDIFASKTKFSERRQVFRKKTSFPKENKFSEGKQKQSKPLSKIYFVNLKGAKNTAVTFCSFV
jgi:hypothetical protein